MSQEKKLRVRRLDDADRSAWNEFVAASPQGTPFASNVYLDAFDVRRDIFVAERASGFEAGIVIARGPVGLATNPLFVKHLGLLYAPFDGKTTSRVSRERKAAAALLPSLKSVRGFDYQFSPGFDDWLPLYWAGFAQQTRYSYRIRGATTTWREAADARTRNDLARADRAGLVFGAPIAVGDVVSLSERTYRRHGARPPFDERKLSGAIKALADAGMGFLAGVTTSGGRTVAAGLLVVDRRTAFLTITGYADDAPAGATTLLIAGLIDEALKRGLDFDFEGSMIEPIESFYRGFGGELRPYFHIWRPGLFSSSKKIAFGAARKILGYAR